MKIIADKNIPLADFLFSKIGDISLVDGRRITSDQIKNADMLLVRTVTPVSEDLLENSRVKIVASATSGTDHVDLEYLENQGIRFFYSPGANAGPVAEYVISALCAIAGQEGFDPRIKRVGIIGCGNAGSQLKHLLRIMDIDCIVNDPPLKHKTGDSDYRDISEVLSADIISLHVPLVDGGPWPTRHLVNASFLNRMKRDAILINTSRGDVVDEEALLTYMDACIDCRIILDVWQNEPFINPALLSRVTIGTPHIAGYSLEGKIRATELVYHQVCDYLGTGDEDNRSYSGFNNYRTGISINRIDDEGEVLRLAVLASYDVRSDGAALRRSVELPESQRGGYFEDMRKASTMRREFSAMTIRLPEGHKQLCSKLKALGFDIAEI